MAYRGPSHFDSAAFDDWVDRWFKQRAIDPGSSMLPPDESNKWKYYASIIPGFGDILRSVSEWDDLQDYMSQNGLTWGDIDPFKAGEKFGSSPIKTILTANSYVSKNISRLYR